MVEYGSFERVGSSRPIEVDVRIVGATNVNLSVMAERKDFKRDLLDRLSFEVLFLPPLRYRGEDIMLLANHFATRMSFELGRSAIPSFSEPVVRALETNSWKGNIRELKNVVERAVYRSDTALIDTVVFDPFVSPYSAVSLADEEGDKENTGPQSLVEGAKAVSIKQAVEELEKTMLHQALTACRFNQRKAAAYLDLTYDQFRGKIRKYGAAFFEQDGRTD